MCGRINNMMLIAVTEAQMACRSRRTLKARLEAAMTATVSHWAITDPDERLQAAVGAAMLESPEEDAEIIGSEWKALKALADIIDGRANIDSMPGYRKIGIMKLWAAVNAGKDK